MTRNGDLPPTASREELEREFEALRRDVQRLQLEHDLLEKANEFIKKDLGIDRRLLENREKTLLVDGPRQIYHYRNSSRGLSSPAAPILCSVSALP
ncbi:transposase IS3/IS911 (plasmid) [Rhizobium grahamii CCGE 502]|uniref:Transposase IS3/IS911 n=1 Tax=Rhizobium grahamii CCGE 502 TaxID=990285 RepID=S3H4T9_9HYPH|nr:transposase IS3/IS911 [Rhizobium grahamii CCGE 502]